LLLPLLQEDASRLERFMGANLLSGEADKKAKLTALVVEWKPTGFDCVDYRHGATGMWMSQGALR
jgi:hypothetical protein